MFTLKIYNNNVSNSFEIYDKEVLKLIEYDSTNNIITLHTNILISQSESDIENIISLIREYINDNISELYCDIIDSTNNNIIFKIPLDKSKCSIKISWNKYQPNINNLWYLTFTIQTSDFNIL